jgi:hypothetical protein
MCEGLFNIDGLDTGVGKWAAQDASVKHTGEGIVGAVERAASNLVDTVGTNGASTDDLEFGIRAGLRHENTSEWKEQWEPEN